MLIKKNSPAKSVLSSEFQVQGFAWCVGLPLQSEQPGWGLGLTLQTLPSAALVNGAQVAVIR